MVTEKTEAQEWLEESGLNLGREDYNYDKLVASIEVRNNFIAKFGFAILTHEAINKISAYQPLVEVGAGSGYWSYELKKSGVDIVATDSKTGRYHLMKEDGKSARWAKEFTEVERLDAVSAVKKYPERNLLTCWPDYDSAWPGEMLAHFTGQFVIYVGEGAHGCTGDERFHKTLDHCFNCEETVYIPQFWGIHDYISIWRRK